MKDVIDIAAYVLQKTDSVSTMKLQKLVYYCQAYSLVDSKHPLFENEIQAWANGPVVPDLYVTHRHQLVVNLESIHFSRPSLDLNDYEKNIVDHVISRIGSLSGNELSEITHSEKPWLNARKGLAPKVRSNRIISRESILDYYSSPSCTNPVFRNL